MIGKRRSASATSLAPAPARHQATAIYHAHGHAHSLDRSTSSYSSSGDTSSVPWAGSVRALSPYMLPAPVRILVRILAVHDYGSSPASPSGGASTSCACYRVHPARLENHARTAASGSICARARGGEGAGRARSEGASGSAGACSRSRGGSRSWLGSMLSLCLFQLSQILIRSQSLIQSQSLSQTSQNRDRDLDLDLADDSGPGPTRHPPAQLGRVCCSAPLWMNDAPAWVTVGRSPRMVVWLWLWMAWRRTKK